MRNDAYSHLPSQAYCCIKFTRKRMNNDLFV